MAGLGPPELIIVLVIVVLIFGVGKLPQIGGALGKSVREFRQASTTSDEAEATVQSPVKQAAVGSQAEGQEVVAVAVETSDNGKSDKVD
jgi:sec-independent protein translocase protein TatA